MSLAVRADVILDTFSERDAASWPMTTTVTDPESPQTNIESCPVSVPGGQRTEGIGCSVMDVEGFDSTTADIYNQNGYSFLDYHSTVGAAATIELGYGQGTPLNLAGVSAIQINFMDYDLSQGGPLKIAATVTQGMNPALQYGLDVTTAGAQTVTLPLTGFAYSSVDSVVLDFTAPKGTDFRINSITAVMVPEPTALALLGLGVPLLLRRRGRAV